MCRPLILQSYAEQRVLWPNAGNALLAHHDDDQCVVYQAYNPAIADWVLTHGKLGGPGFKLTRASWIKPSFLWMMYRCGWCTKPNQERVLALWIRRADLEALLTASELSHYRPDHHQTEVAWKRQVARTNVRVQWDPDRTPGGGALRRRAIQIGLIGPALRSFAEDAIVRVQDMTTLALEQGARLHTPDDVLLPSQTVMQVRSAEARERALIDSD